MSVDYQPLEYKQYSNRLDAIIEIHEDRKAVANPHTHTFFRIEVYDIHEKGDFFEIDYYIDVESATKQIADLSLISMIEDKYIESISFHLNGQLLEGDIHVQ